jgi:signal transduction histidine kinase
MTEATVATETHGIRAVSRLRRRLPKGVRLRLTVLYTIVFLAGGIVLLSISYALVSNSLGSGTTPPNPLASPTYRLTQACKAELNRPVLGKPKPGAPADLACQKAFYEGALAEQANQRDHTMSELLKWSIVGLIGLTVASAGLGWMMAGRVLRPVHEITEAARRASERHLGERINMGGPEDELRELADTFDAMLERLDLSFATQRQFVANASHELRTPLTAMRTAIDVTLAKPARTPEQMEAMAERVRRAIDRAERTVDALLTLAVSNQGASAAVEPLDLATAAEDALDLVDGRVHASGLRVDTEIEPAEVTGNRALLERMVANLVENAVVHNVPDGWVRVRVGANNGHAYVEVANSGPIVKQDDLPHLFEPFRRGAARIGSTGVGLGLSIVQSVGEAHGAEVKAVASAGGGLTVSVTMPSRSNSPV